ncbi:tetratricopeptide repeat protein [Salinispirillum sp. LH 10-3-1]|uniref:Ancillary SecYEG translocon subunit n=1 Tax=Salinispirillum sp. LH 10-3-1 TaxID=2952525 RepID=A0AB38YDG0_9GAMM
MYDTEQEQIEALKQWWSRWGNALVGGVLIFVVGYFGLFFYNDNQAKNHAAASDIYQQVVRLTDGKDTLAATERSRLDDLFANLSSAHSNSTYTTYTALLQAKYMVNDGDFADAETKLRWALEQSRDATIDRVITLRIARVQVAQGEFDAALATLDGIAAGAQELAFYELRGDIHQAMGDRNAARAAYETAWTLAQEQGLNPPLLQAKAERFGLL